MTVKEMNDTMPNDEYLQWRAYHVWRNAEIELAKKKGAASGG